jgi:uroporphyrin-III C-methyltransferase
MNDPRADDPKDERGDPQEPPATLPPGEREDAPPAEDRTPETKPPETIPPGAEARATPAEPMPPASTGRSMGVVLGLFALLVAFAAAGGVAFTWWQVAEYREATAGQSAEASATLANIRDLVATTQERLAVQEERLARLNSDAEARRSTLEGLDAELRQARARLEALAKEEAGPERSPSLAEIEFLLLLAGRELILADNSRVALAALREADQRIARLDEPGFGEVRAAINDEIAAVEAVAEVDFDGIALRLSSLSRRVDGLPLRASLAPDPRQAERAEEGQSGWQRLLGRMQGVASDLFRIRRTDAPASPLLAPNESFFLYRNVELDLKSARLAVFARDQENYSASLDAARSTLNEYFETGDDAVKSLLAAIEDLEQRDIAPKWPEISRSLSLLRSAGAMD